MLRIEFFDIMPIYDREKNVHMSEKVYTFNTFEEASEYAKSLAKIGIKHKLVHKNDSYLLYEYDISNKSNINKNQNINTHLSYNVSKSQLIYFVLNVMSLLKLRKQKSVKNVDGGYVIRVARVHATIMGINSVTMTENNIKTFYIIN